MVPRRLFALDKRTMTLILLITFLSGGNFIAMLLFWPTQTYNMYGNYPVKIGLRTLPIGFGIIGGAVISLVMIGLSKGRIRIIMPFWTVVMTAFVGAMSVADLHNLHTLVYPIVTLANIGVGAVIIPCSIIAQIVCPTELIGTITAITLSIRYIGGAIGFTAFYVIFYHKMNQYGIKVGTELAVEGVSYNLTTLRTLVTLAAQSEYANLHEFIEESPNVMMKDKAYELVIQGTQKAFAKAYQWPYWMSIAFGGLCVIFSFGLRDMGKLM